MISRHLIIRGQVQGVFFRQSAQKKAVELDIQGTVRNCADGTVEIIAEGNEEEIMLFIEWCHQGPKASRVEVIDINEHPLKNFRGFIITY